jgi:hypothetical protein
VKNEEQTPAADGFSVGAEYVLPLGVGNQILVGITLF